MDTSPRNFVRPAAMAARARARTAAVTLATLAALSLLTVACGSSKKASTTSSPATGATASTAAPSSSSPSSSSGAAANASVMVATVGKYGQVLVAPDGKTLYLFEQDKGTTTACGQDPCKATWPGLATTGAPTPGTGVDGSKLGVASGQVPNQLTYGGHLLYEFAGDHKPGDVNGVSIPGWYPVSPSGAKVDTDAGGGSSTTATTSMGNGGGY